MRLTESTDFAPGGTDLVSRSYQRPARSALERQCSSITKSQGGFTAVYSFGFGRGSNHSGILPRSVGDNGPNDEYRRDEEEQHERAAVLVLAQLLRQHHRLMLRTGLVLRQAVKTWGPYQGLASSRDPEETLLELVSPEIEDMLRETLQTTSGIGLDWK